MSILGKPDIDLDEIEAAIRLPMQLNRAAWRLGKKGYHLAQEMAAWAMLPPNHFGTGKPAGQLPESGVTEDGPIVPDYHETLALEPAPLGLPEGRGA